MQNKITATNNWLEDLQHIYDEAIKALEAQKEADEAQKAEARKLQEREEARKLRERLEFLGIELSGTPLTNVIELDGISFAYQGLHPNKGILVSIDDKKQYVSVDIGKDRVSQQVALFKSISSISTLRGRSKQNELEPEADPRRQQAEAIKSKCRFIDDNDGSKECWYDDDYTGYKDNAIRIWDKAGKTILWLNGHGEPVFRMENANIEIFRPGPWQEYLDTLYLTLKAEVDRQEAEKEAKEEKERQEFEVRRFAPIEWEIEDATAAAKEAAQLALNPSPVEEEKVLDGFVEVAPEAPTVEQRLMTALRDLIETELYGY
jgi:hypothetical protein